MRATSAFLVIASIASLGAGCASHRAIRTVQRFRAASAAGDAVAARACLAPDARMWFDRKTGPGDPLGFGGGRWDHWDRYFHGRTMVSEWEVHGHDVTGVVHETNDLYHLLDWIGKPYRLTWTLDESGRIKEVLLDSIPGARERSNRMPEFKRWAAEHHPEELAYLLPNGQMNPDGDRAERWRAILVEWRAAAGLPPVQ
jgi:ketosteroid isomerase-like protein